MEYRVNGDLIITDPKPYSIYLRGTRFCSGSRAEDLRFVHSESKDNWNADQ